MPQEIARTFRKRVKQFSWEETWTRALALENALIDERGDVPSLSKVYAASDGRGEPAKRDNTTVKRQRPAQGVRGACFACGSTEHFKRDCEFRNSRCAKCLLIGHLSSVCTNYVLKDNKGRVEMRVEPKPSGTNIHQRKDRSQKDKMLSAEAVLGVVRKVAEQRSEKAAQRRREKKSESRWVRKKADVQHTVAAALEDAESEPSDEDDEGFSFVDEVEKLLHVYTAAEQHGVPSTVIVRATAAGIVKDVLADSGAIRSLISKEVAKELRAEATSETRTFVGVGSRVGRLCKPMKVEFGERSISLNFWMIDVPQLPILIGAVDLRAMDVLIDPVTNQLLDRETHEVVAVGVEVKECPDVPDIDVVTQKAANATDEELLEGGMKVLDEKMSHLPPKEK